MALQFVDTVKKFAAKRQLLYWTKVDIQGWDNQVINYGSYQSSCCTKPSTLHSYEVLLVLSKRKKKVRTQKFSSKKTQKR
jgi:hypothetical protein